MEIKARVPGKIDEIKVKVGDEVKKGDVVLIMEAMKMKQPLQHQKMQLLKKLRFLLAKELAKGT